MGEVLIWDGDRHIPIMEYVEKLEAENAELKAELEIAIQTLVDVAEASGLTESLEQMRKGKGRRVR